MFVPAHHDTDLTFFINQHVTRSVGEITLSPQFDSFLAVSVTSLYNASSCLWYVYFYPLTVFQC